MDNLKACPFCGDKPQYADNDIQCRNYSRPYFDSQ